MKPSACAAIVLIVALGCLECNAQTTSQNQLTAKSQAFDAYTPTKMEWLLLWANATLRNRDINGQWSISYRQGETTDTIEILVSILSTADRQLCNIFVQVAREDLEKEARRRGWDWVQIREFYWVPKPASR